VRNNQRSGSGAIMNAGAKSWVGVLMIGLLAWSSCAWAADVSCAQLTGLQRVAGYVTFANTVKVLAVLVGAGFAAVFLRGLVARLLMIFVAIPLSLYKALGYLVSIGLIGWSHAVHHGLIAATPGSADSLADIARYVAVAGALGLGGSVLVSLSDWAKIHGAGPRPNETSAAILTLLFGALALGLGNSLIGAFAVAALMAFFGFFVFSSPGLVVLGFESEKELFSGTAAAFFLLVPATLMVAHQGNLGVFDVFRPGIFWVASFTGYTGLLILASWSMSKSALRYAARQALMILMGFAALYFGSVAGIETLQKIGGTFFVVYLLSKPWDLPKTNVLAWSGLGLLTCVALFGVMHEVGQHPARWAAWLLL
jgi:hypothetical protein